MKKLLFKSFAGTDKLKFEYFERTDLTSRKIKKHTEEQRCLSFFLYLFKLKTKA